MCSIQWDKIYFLKANFKNMCVGVLTACVFVCHVLGVVAEEGIRSGNGAIDSCESPCGCWEPDPDLLKNSQDSHC